MGSGGQRLPVLLLWAFCACVSVHGVPASDASLIPWESYHKTEQILDFFKKVSLKVPSRVRCGPCPGSGASLKAPPCATGCIRLLCLVMLAVFSPGLELADLGPGMRRSQTQSLISACQL